MYKEFLELNVSFYLMNNIEDEIKQIKIQFDLDQFSNDFNPQPVNNVNEYSLIFNAECKELLKLAGELQVELDQFPVR